MKKTLSLFICFSLLAAPFQVLAETTNEVPGEATTNLPQEEASLGEVPASENNETPDKIQESVPEENLPITETPIANSDKLVEFKSTLFNRQRIKTLVNKKADTVLATQEMLTLAGLIDEIIYELAALMELEYEDIDISDEEYLALGREILVSYYQYADYLLATHKEIYTEASLANLKASVVAARQHLNTNDVTFNSMETHFYQLQNQVMLLDKIPDFTLDTTALERLLTDISEATLNKKEYVLSIYTIFEELHVLAKEMIAGIKQGEVIPQKEVDTLTKQLQLAYTSLVKKDGSKVPATEAINLNLTDTSGKYPILAEAQSSEIMVRAYGDNGVFQEDGTSRIAVYVAGQPIFEEFITNDDGLYLTLNKLNTLILTAKLEALEAGVSVPDLPLVTRNYQINVSDKRTIPTEVVVIPEQTDYPENVTLTGGNFGQSHLVYNYDPEWELITLDYYFSAPKADSEPLESTELSVDEPLLVSVQKDGKEQLVRLVFEKEIKDDKPKPPIKDPDDQKDKNKDKDKDKNDKQKNNQTDKNKKNQNSNKGKGKNLPKTNELTKGQFMLQLIGTYLIALAFYKWFKQTDSLTKLDN